MFEIAARITALMREAQPHLAISAAELDTHPHLFNFLNGEVDLQTGKLLPHEPDHLLTKIVEYNFIPEAVCPRWMEFLSQAVGDDLTSFLQRAVGYSLTGSTREKVVFICNGPTDAGKSTFLSTLLHLFGPYATLLQVDTLMTRPTESNNAMTDLADLRGARLAVTSETEQGARLAEAKIKRISQGQGKIKATRKYENPIEFLESHKLWLDCNDLPVVRGTDNAIWNRLRLIPFENSIPKEQIDRELPRKLLAEAEGILARAVQGAVEWYRDGIGHPQQVEAASNRWRAESDQLGRFLADCCTLGEYAQAKARQLYSSYQNWVEIGGERITMSARDFSVALMGRGGFTKEHKEYGEVYLGVGLKADP